MSAQLNEMHGFLSEEDLQLLSDSIFNFLLLQQSLTNDCPQSRIFQQCKFCFFLIGSAEEFNYTKMGGSTVIEGVDDKENMVETQKTFALLGKLFGIPFQ